MITGASQADVALIMVPADGNEGIFFQGPAIGIADLMLPLLQYWASASELDGCLVQFILTAKLVLNIISGSFEAWQCPCFKDLAAAV